MRIATEARTTVTAPQASSCTLCSARLARDNAARVCAPCQRRTRAAAADPTFWTVEPLSSAVASCDLGAVVRAFRQHPHHGAARVPQRLVAVWRGVSQAQVCRIETGANKVNNLDTLTAWADALLMPSHLRWWRADTSDVSAPLPDPATVEGTDQEEEDMQRRHLLKLTGVVAASTLAPAPWERLAAALSRPCGVDEVTMGILESRTAEFFIREELIPARELLADLLAHGETLARLVPVNTGNDMQRRLLAALGETEALAGWLAFDMQQSSTALKHYDNARRAAEEAGDGPLLACVMGYLSYMSDTQGDPEESHRILTQAQRYVTGPSSAATRSWLAAREAETCAALGDERGTDRALERAYVAFDYANPLRERVWTSFFSASRMGSMAVSAYVHLQHSALEQTATSVLAALSSSENKVKAIVYADLAAAALQVRDYEQATAFVEHSLDTTVRTETSIAKDRLRILARTLPRQPNDARVRQLRDQLATLA